MNTWGTPRRLRLLGQDRVLHYMEGRVRIELTNSGVAIRCLTTWLSTHELRSVRCISTPHNLTDANGHASLKLQQRGFVPLRDVIENGRVHEVEELAITFNGRPVEKNDLAAVEPKHVLEALIGHRLAKHFWHHHGAGSAEAGELLDGTRTRVAPAPFTGWNCGHGHAGHLTSTQAARTGFEPVTIALTERRTADCATWQG